MKATLVDYREYRAYFPTTGVTQEALLVQKRVNAIQRKMSENATYGKTIYELFDELFDVYNECSTENWDGYDAAAIEVDVFEQACRFIISLPIAIPLPDIAPDPDGEISFEWYINQRYVFSVSINSNGRLSYAGLFGPERACGTAYFQDQLPQSVLIFVRTFQ